MESNLLYTCVCLIRFIAIDLDIKIYYVFLNQHLTMHLSNVCVFIYIYPIKMNNRIRLAHLNWKSSQTSEFVEILCIICFNVTWNWALLEVNKTRDEIALACTHIYINIWTLIGVRWFPPPLALPVIGRFQLGYDKRSGIRRGPHTGFHGGTGADTGG